MGREREFGADGRECIYEGLLALCSIFQACRLAGSLAAAWCEK